MTEVQLRYHGTKPAAEEVARDLERQIAEVTSKIDEYISAQSAALTSGQQEHEAAMRELETRIARLKADHAALGLRVATTHGQLTSEKQLLAQRQDELGRLEAAASSLPSELDTVRAKREAAQLQHAGARAELERTEVVVRQQLADFARGLDAFKRLGLEFENVAGAAGSNNIRVVFTRIDPRDPARRFVFDVAVSPADDSYAISACNPPVQALSELTARLNSDNNFAAFVQLMRIEFKNLAR